MFLIVDWMLVLSLTYFSRRKRLPPELIIPFFSFEYRTIPRKYGSSRYRGVGRRDPFFLQRWDDDRIRVICLVIRRPCSGRLRTIRHLQRWFLLMPFIFFFLVQEGLRLSQFIKFLLFLLIQHLFWNSYLYITYVLSIIAGKCRIKKRISHLSSHPFCSQHQFASRKSNSRLPQNSTLSFMEANGIRGRINRFTSSTRSPSYHAQTQANSKATPPAEAPEANQHKNPRDLAYHSRMHSHQNIVRTLRSLRFHQ